jgi:phosphotransferase system enzyme I (PtsP)
MPHSKDAPIGITTLEDISALILQSHDLNETLRNIVALVARRMKADVCSIYLLDYDQQTLRLRATKGLSRRAVGKVTMQIGEGLTGMAAQERHPVAIKEPENHPRYRYFKETGEEKFHSFLGIPLFDRNAPLGVIVLQNRELRDFRKEEISALSTIAFQISSIVVNARLLDSIRAKEEEARQVAAQLEVARQSLAVRETAKSPTGVSALTGTVAYPGVANGAAVILQERLGFADILHEDAIDSEVELRRLDSALEKTTIQTLFLEKRVAERLSESDAAIFHTHLMILEDRSFIEKLRNEIRQGHGAPYALEKVVAGYIEAFSRMDDAYLRERAADMEDIGRRLLANLVGNGSDHLLQIRHPGILVARQLLPSDMAALDAERILGIVTEVGEQNSHAVIMAKSMGISTLVAVRGLLKAVAPDDELILDANSGRLYINPPAAIRKEYRRLIADQSREQSRLEEFRERPARTADGTRITLRANIGLISDIEVAHRFGAEGVGLYRTEFPYMARGDFPNRDDQYELYRRVVEGFAGQPVTIRTLDIGGDKVLPYFAPPDEDNPFMGWRSVRVSLDNRDIFRTQIEAILMAAQHGPVRLLFPMISSLDEVRACRAVIAEAQSVLRRARLPHARNLPMGVMIEVPAAVRLVTRLAREVDFFALGTNDLIQYLLAADRNNPLVSKYYDPLHPAVLQAIAEVVANAASFNRNVCLCGEMATDPHNLLALLGMGLREFSMPAPYIPRTKAFLAGISLDYARQAWNEVAELDTSTEIHEKLGQMIDAIPAVR